MTDTPLKIYRFIPLVLLLLCLTYGLFIISYNNPDSFIAGHIVIFLGMVCFTLFCLSSIITIQIIYDGKEFDNIIYPALGFISASITILYGIFLYNHDIVYYKVAGHNVLGLGLICLCIATETIICTKFNIIRENNNLKSDPTQANFSKNQSRLLILIPIIAVIIGWAWAIYLIMYPDVNDNFIPGHVMAGMAMICTCVLAAVVTSIKQIKNSYLDIDKKIWPGLAFTMGFISLLWGLILLIMDKNPATYLSPGFILIGISCVCFSIFSKLLLVSRSWRYEFRYIQSVPFISLFLVLICFSLSFFLFQGAVNDINIYIPARVLVGLGSVCLSLFAVINIVEISKVR